MRKEAEANADADKATRERVEKLNEADAMIFQTEKQLTEFGDKLSEGNKSTIGMALTELKMAYEAKDVTAIQPALDRINEAWKNASEEMYKQGGDAQQGGQQQGQPEAGQPEGDNVQDVDFEEVK
jgi:molecular chaperone DnaK